MTVTSPENSKTKEQRKIDLQIAEKLGLVNIRYLDRWGDYVAQAPLTKTDIIVPRYSINFEAAWKIVKHLKSQEYEVRLKTKPGSTEVKILDKNKVCIAEAKDTSEARAITTAFIGKFL